ncbi:hypothetical protein [Metaclostridioides mangenotii]|uniref:hypothetical protein n=1 Tax=Metaclostridioides mangenotii TaxID=1540 RepID=UPI0026EE6FC2|nr:hypothetical protein [Clostridioides mangenotii]
MEYDVKYKYNSGKTIVHIVSPERILKRKMTQMEIQYILDDVKKLKIERLKRISFQSCELD